MLKFAFPSGKVPAWPFGPPHCGVCVNGSYARDVSCSLRLLKVAYSHVRCQRTMSITGRMPRSGKLPVLFLLTGQKSGFSPRRGDSLHRFRSNFAVPTGTLVRLARRNFTSIGAERWECGPQNIKNFHFLVKSRPAGATPLTDFRNF